MSHVLRSRSIRSPRIDLPLPSFDLRRSFTIAGALLLAFAFAAPPSESQVVRKWTRQQPGFRAVDVAIDDDGFVYVSGLSPLNQSNGFRHDIVTVKYDGDGNIVWLRVFDEDEDQTFGTDTPSWVTLDPEGNLLVTGRSFINTSGDDMITLKYSPDGDLLWKARTTTAISGRRVATDAAGNVFVAGRDTDASSRDYFTIKYDMNGNELWSRTYNGPNNFTDEVNGLAVTAEGDVVVTGESTGGVTSFDLATVYYESDGTQRWARRFTSPGSEIDAGRDVAIGPAGEIFVSGHIIVNNTPDYVVVEYDAAGNEVDVMTFGTPGSDLGGRVAADSGGNAIITGNSNSDIVTVKFDPDGQMLWASTYESGGEDFPSGIAVGADDSIYITGESSQQVVTLKYNPDGTEAWNDVVVNSVFPDRGYNVAVDAADNVAVAAQSPILALYYTQTGALALTIESGTCPGTVTARVDNAPPGTEVAVLAAANTNGFIKGGLLCNGTSLEVGEPFQLPPSFVLVDGSGSGTVELTIEGDLCWLEALALASCQTSGAVQAF